MAREIVIRILEERSLAPDPEADGGSASSRPSESASEKKEKTLKQLMGAYIGKRVWNILKNEAKYFTGKYFSATENYKAQSYVDNTLDTIDFAVSTGFSMFAAGKLFADTAIGGVGGMALAVGAAVVQKSVGAFNKYSDEAQKIINNTYGNYFYAERSGYVAGGHGTEN